MLFTSSNHIVVGPGRSNSNKCVFSSDCAVDPVEDAARLHQIDIKPLGVTITEPQVANASSAMGRANHSHISSSLSANGVERMNSTLGTSSSVSASPYRTTGFHDSSLPDVPPFSPSSTDFTYKAGARLLPQEEKSHLYNEISTSSPPPSPRERTTPSSMLSSSTRTLSLIHQNITALRHLKDLPTLVSLRSLHLHMNHIREIEPNIFRPLSLLEDLDMSANDLTSIEDDAFTGLGRLRRLDASGNAIRTLSPHCFAPLRSLQWLSLGLNFLRDVDAILSLPPSAHLRYLDIGGNCIPRLHHLERGLREQRQHITKLRLRVVLPKNYSLKEREEEGQKDGQVTILGEMKRGEQKEMTAEDITVYHLPLRENPFVLRPPIGFQVAAAGTATGGTAITTVGSSATRSRSTRRHSTTPLVEGVAAVEGPSWYTTHVVEAFPSLLLLDDVRVGADPLREALVHQQEMKRRELKGGGTQEGLGRTKKQSEKEENEKKERDLAPLLHHHLDFSRETSSCRSNHHHSSGGDRREVKSNGDRWGMGIATTTMSPSSLSSSCPLSAPSPVSLPSISLLPTPSSSSRGAAMNTSSHSSSRRPNTLLPAKPASFSLCRSVSSRWGRKPPGEEGQKREEAEVGKAEGQGRAKEVIGSSLPLPSPLSASSSFRDGGNRKGRKRNVHLHRRIRTASSASSASSNSSICSIKQPSRGCSKRNSISSSSPTLSHHSTTRMTSASSSPLPSSSRGRGALSSKKVYPATAHQNRNGGGPPDDVPNTSNGEKEKERRKRTSRMREGMTPPPPMMKMMTEKSAKKEEEKEERGEGEEEKVDTRGMMQPTVLDVASCSSEDRKISNPMLRHENDRKDSSKKEEEVVEGGVLPVPLIQTLDKEREKYLQDFITQNNDVKALEQQIHQYALAMETQKREMDAAAAAADHRVKELEAQVVALQQELLRKGREATIIRKHLTAASQKELSEAAVRYQHQLDEVKLTVYQECQAQAKAVQDKMRMEHWKEREDLVEVAKRWEKQCAAQYHSMTAAGMEREKMWSKNWKYFQQRAELVIAEAEQRCVLERAWGSSLFFFSSSGVKGDREKEDEDEHDAQMWRLGGRGVTGISDDADRYHISSCARNKNSHRRHVVLGSPSRRPSSPSDVWSWIRGFYRIVAIERQHYQEVVKFQQHQQDEEVERLRSQWREEKEEWEKERCGLTTSLEEERSCHALSMKALHEEMERKIMALQRGWVREKEGEGEDHRSVSGCTENRTDDGVCLGPFPTTSESTNSPAAPLSPSSCCASWPWQQSLHQLYTICDVLMETQRGMYKENDRLLHQVKEWEYRFQQGIRERDTMMEKLQEQQKRQEQQQREEAEATGMEEKKYLEEVTADRDALQREVRNLRVDLEHKGKLLQELEAEAMKKLDEKRQRIAALQEEVDQLREQAEKSSSLAVEYREQLDSQHQQLHRLQKGLEGIISTIGRGSSSSRRWEGGRKKETSGRWRCSRSWSIMEEAVREDRRTSSAHASSLGAADTMRRGKNAAGEEEEEEDCPLATRMSCPHNHTKMDFNNASTTRTGYRPVHVERIILLVEDMMEEFQAAAHQIEEYEADQQELLAALRRARNELIRMERIRQALERSKEEEKQHTQAHVEEIQKLRDKINSIDQESKAKQAAALEVMTQMIKAGL